MPSSSSPVMIIICFACACISAMPKLVLASNCQLVVLAAENSVQNTTVSVAMCVMFSEYKGLCR